MFLVPFLFVALKLKDSRVLEKEIRRKHANIREHEVKVTQQIWQNHCAFRPRDGAGTEVYIVVDKTRKINIFLILWCCYWIVYGIVPKQPSSLNFDVIWHQTVHVTCYTCRHIACKQTNTSQACKKEWNESETRFINSLEYDIFNAY